MAPSIFQDITVIDLSTMIAGPLVSGIIGDFGADVIKVEAVGMGDPLRQVGRNFHGQNVRSKVTNRNKRSVSVDLHYEEGRDIVRSLIAKADAVVTNFRAETLEAWGLDYDTVTTLAPDVVWLHITGFGLTGDYAHLPSFAPIAESFGGLAYVSGDPQGPPQVSSASMGDLLAGVYGAFALTSGLLHRARTGEGQLVDLGLYEPILRVLESLIVDYDLSGHVQQRWGNEVPGTVPSNLYRTSDDSWVALAASTQPVFERLCRAIGLWDMVEDPAYATNSQRVEKREEINSAVQKAIEVMAYDDFRDAMTTNAVPYSKVLSAQDIFSDPHILSRGNLEEVYDPNLNREIKMQSPVPFFHKTPGKVQRPGPEPGEDSADVLTNMLGMSDEQLERLRQTGVIG